MTPKKLIYLIIALLAIALLGGCSGLRGKTLTYMTNKKYEPYKGQVQVFWPLLRGNLRITKMNPLSSTLFAEL